MTISTDAAASTAPIISSSNADTSTSDNLSKDDATSSTPGTRKKLHGRAFYESIGSPKFVLAPMVDQSEFVGSSIFDLGIRI
jgi:tRNA-dihydrouridine synthase 1